MGVHRAHRGRFSGSLPPSLRPKPSAPGLSPTDLATLRDPLYLTKRSAAVLPTDSGLMTLLT